MHFKKFFILFLSTLVYSCSPTEARNDYYVGETGTQGWMTLSFEEYNITHIDEDNFF